MHSPSQQLHLRGISWVLKKDTKQQSSLVAYPSTLGFDSRPFVVFLLLRLFDVIAMSNKISKNTKEYKSKKMKKVRKIKTLHTVVKIP